MRKGDLHVIVGLGLTGFSCVGYLQKKGIPIAITDSRMNPPCLCVLQEQYPHLPISLGQIDPALLEKAAKIIISPGVALSEPVIKDQMKQGTPIMGDIELFAQTVRAPVIAITGTNAKSTVTTLVSQMVAAAGYSVQAGGNLGIPILDLLATMPDVFVLEISSFQLEVTRSLCPRVATILNITEDHMDRYQSFAHYQAVKRRIYEHCQVAVCNGDDPLTDITQNRKVYFTLQSPRNREFGLLTTTNGRYLAFEQEQLLPITALPICGQHYQANALAALAIGHAFGLPMAPMLQVLCTFKGLPHRCQFVRNYRQVLWYNDSKATNVGAACAAIMGLGESILGKIILIAGGVGKNACFDSLRPVVEKRVRQVILIGEAALEIAAVLAVSPTIDIMIVAHLQEAVWQAQKKAQPHDCVLLSPACASFDMFENYIHRGEEFMKIVHAL